MNYLVQLFDVFFISYTDSHKLAVILSSIYFNHIGKQYPQRFQRFSKSQCLCVTLKRPKLYISNLVHIHATRILVTTETERDKIRISI